MNTQTFNIALPADLVKKVDELAKKEFRSRSDLIREALRSYIKNNQKWEELFSYGASIEEEVNKTVAAYRHAKKSA